MSLVQHTMHTLTSGCGLTSLTLVRALHCSPPLAGKKWKYHSDRDLKAPEPFTNTVQPERHRLPIFPKTPSFWTNVKAPKQTKELWRMMGEEKVHNDLVLDQYAIIATNGGMMTSKHFEVLRLAVGKYVKPKESFAIYRVDAPYKPITNHGFGKRMGGGKGSIETYATPVRAGRVIVEVGGKVLWEEVRGWLNKIVVKLPFDAIAVNAEMLKKMREEEKRLERTNKNPISFEWLVRNNMMNCQEHLSDYDQRWFGKFVYKDRELNLKWQQVLKSRYRGGN